MTRKTTLTIAGAAVIALILYGVTSHFTGSVAGPTSTVESMTTTTVPDATQPTGDWTAYSADGFSVRYPAAWSAQGAYVYQALGPGRDINGHAFGVPAALTTNTNLSDDSKMTVERIAGGSACTAASFLVDALGTKEVEENGRTWSVAKGGGAGAGNFYDETVYATRIGDDCYGLRLFIHSTNIGNYDPGTVTEFNRAELDAAFAQFRASFTTTN